MRDGLEEIALPTLYDFFTTIMHSYATCIIKKFIT